MERQGNIGSMASLLCGWHVQNDTKNHLKRNCRNKMTLVSQFLRPIKKVINFGYKSLAPAGSRIGSFQKAQSNLFKNAISVDEHEAAIYPNSALAYLLLQNAIRISSKTMAHNAFIGI